MIIRLESSERINKAELLPAQPATPSVFAGAASLINTGAQENDPPPSCPTPRERTFKRMPYSVKPGWLLVNDVYYYICYISAK